MQHWLHSWRRLGITTQSELVQFSERSESVWKDGYVTLTRLITFDAKWAEKFIYLRSLGCHVTSWERKFVISRSVSPPPNVGPVFWGLGGRAGSTLWCLYIGWNDLILWTLRWRDECGDWGLGEPWPRFQGWTQFSMTPVDDFQGNVSKKADSVPEDDAWGCLPQSPVPTSISTHMCTHALVCTCTHEPLWLVLFSMYAHVPDIQPFQH